LFGVSRWGLFGDVLVHSSWEWIVVVRNKMGLFWGRVEYSRWFCVGDMEGDS
jgi:hypothetical protein